MADFTKLILTDVGKTLLHQEVFAEEALVFTRIELSDHTYEEAELRGLEGLDDVRQQNPIRKVTVEEDIVTVDFIINNETLEMGYFIRAMGLYARMGDGEEVLFAAAVEKSGGCHMPQMSETVTSIQIKLQLRLENTEKVSLVLDTAGLAAVGDVLDVQNLVLEERERAQEAEGELREQIEAEAARAAEKEAQLETDVGEKADTVQVDGHISNTTVHITADERTKWNDKMEADGNAGNATVTFSQASTRTNILSGEPLKTIMGKIMKWFADLKAVAFSGSYNDLSNKPVIPTVNNAKLTIQKNGANVQTFSANQSSDATANIIVPTKVSQLTNDSGYKTTDNNVTQTSVSETDNSNYRVLLSGAPNDNTLTETVCKAKGITYNPSRNSLDIKGQKAFINLEGKSLNAGIEVKDVDGDQVIKSYVNLDYVGMSREYEGEFLYSEMDFRGIYTTGDLTVNGYMFSELLEVLANMLFPLIGLDNVAFNKVKFIRHIGYNDSNIYRHYGGNYKSIFVIVQQYTDSSTESGYLGENRRLFLTLNCANLKSETKAYKFFDGVDAGELKIGYNSDSKYFTFQDTEQPCSLRYNIFGIKK